MTRKKKDPTVVAPDTLTYDMARELLRAAIEDGGDVDARIMKMKEWSDKVDWSALRAEIENE